MKSLFTKTVLALSFVLLSIAGRAQDPVVYIPDANFKAALLSNPNINTNGDNEIQVDEARYFYGDINVSGKNIADLTGIAAFSNASSVDCSNNQLTTLDVSHNSGYEGFAVYCQNNQLTSLLVSPYTYTIRCDNNRLTLLDLSKSDPYYLYEVYCQNNQLTELRLPPRTELFNHLQCDHNQLTSLDMSKLTDLFDLQVQNNQLATLDVSANYGLRKLNCSANALTSLNMKNGNNKNISGSSFNATNNPALKCIDVSDIIYAQANWANDVDAGVKFSGDCADAIAINIPDANFKAALLRNSTINTNGDNEIQVAEAEVVQTLNVPNQSIASLTGIEQFVSLTSLNCSGNNLASLNVSSNKQLTQLRCYDNVLTSLTVSGLTKLELLRCDNNQLSALNLTSNSSLISLRCSNNKIATLDVSANKVLTELDCSNNQLTQLNVRNGNNVNFTVFDATVNPNLTCIQVDDFAWAEANWRNKVDATASFSTDCRPVTIPDSNFKAALLAIPSVNFNNDKEIQIVEATTFSGSIDVSGKNISNLTGIQAFTALTGLNCNNNSLTKIDLSKNSALQTLSCTTNQLSELRLNFNPNLVTVNCSNNILDLLYLGNNKSQLRELIYENNKLPYVDLSACTALQTLRCSNNSISAINNITSNVLETLEFDHNRVALFIVPQHLTTLHCSYNNLTLLDVSKTSTLRDFDCRNNVLRSLNLKNGTNSQWTAFNATGNPNLTCIKVDDVNFAETNWRDKVDANAFFSVDCADPNAVYIPDLNFKAILLGNPQINTNGDGEIQFSEAAAFNSYLNLDARDIYDLTGIEAFTSLYQLNCEHNYLKTLDMSANTGLRILECGYNQLTSLKMNTGIVDLTCYWNQQLETLDLSPYTDLKSFSSGGDPLNALDFRNNINLTSVEVSHANITTLDLSANVNLTEVYVSLNDKLTSINIKNGNNTKIQIFYGYSNPLLTCVQVDDVTYAKAHFVPSSLAFSTNCFGSSSFAAASNTASTDKTEMRIYPNPATNKIMITGTQEITEVMAYNQSSGEAMTIPFNSSNREADISHFQNATYLIKVTSSQSVDTFRIVKK